MTDPLTAIAFATAAAKTIQALAGAVEAMHLGAATPEQVALLEQNLLHVRATNQADTDATLAKLKAIAERPVG